MAEHGSYKAEGAGSSPAVRTVFFGRIAQLVRASR